MISMTKKFLLEQWQADRHRAFYWLPVFMGCGIAWYFGLQIEPLGQAIWGGLALAVLGVWMVARYGHERPYLRIGAWACLFFMLGIALAQGRTALLDTKMLREALRPMPIAGTVESIDRQSQGGRLVLIDLEWPQDRLPENIRELPEKIRLKTRADLSDINIGDRVSMLAQLMPPTEPAMPGAYNFGRQMYFDGLGAVGFGYGKPRKLAEGEMGHWRIRLNDLRDRIILRVYKVLHGDTGAIAAALITSEQKGLSDEATQNMRRSGLQHILSVSGLHLSLMGGLIFFAVRFLLIWSPSSGVRSKKIAALCAIAATFFYLTLSGFEIPTQRAFIMVALVFLAILVDREAISMRIVAFAAVLILATAPETLLSVSFQLSFAAVVALISVYESWLRASSGGDENWFLRVIRYFVLAAATSLIASLATAPFIAYHFHQTTFQGILANLLASPLVSFWLMPLVIIVLLLMPFGLDHWPLVAMGWGVDGLMNVAQMTAHMPGALIMIPSMPLTALVAFLFGGLWLLLWLQPWRYLGLVGIAAGAVLALSYVQPDILISEDASLIAVRGDQGGLGLSSLKKERFIAEIWNKAYAQPQSVDWRDPSLWDETERFLCDSMGCIMQRNGHRILFAFKPAAFSEDCGNVDWIITALPSPASCRAQAHVLDGLDIKRQGATAIWLKDNPTVESVRGENGYRPWNGASPPEWDEESAAAFDKD